MSVRAVLVDIEGTTSSLSFVHDTLFPYADRLLDDFVHAHPGLPEVAAALAAARAAEPDRAPLTVLHDWIAADRKVTELKSLQGAIWRAGYIAGELHGHLWPDSAPALQAWAARGLQLAVFSSGSVAAQQLLFGHSTAGDLRPLFSAWFDTHIGAKRDPQAYRAIVAALGMPAADILFLSDVVEELDAARAAGLRTCCIERGEDGLPPAHSHARAADLASVPGLG
ncbi:MAG: acireductone synthase [Pseudomonadota bacterium]|nr:acireductone synthase [Pseudomonadota bacterium]